MALDKTTLINDLKAMFDYEALQEDHPEDSRQRVAQKMADAIDKYVKSGDGKYQAGTLTAGTTAVTAVGSGATIKMT